MFSKLILLGYVGGDPEVQTNSNTGDTYVTFSVGVSTGKNEKRVTKWHKCSTKLDTNTAKYCMEFVKKGDIVYIEGLPLANSYINSDKQMISEVNCYINIVEHFSKNVKPSNSSEEDTDPMGRLNSLPVASGEGI